MIKPLIEINGLAAETHFAGREINDNPLSNSRHRRSMMYHHLFVLAGAVAFSMPLQAGPSNSMPLQAGPSKPTTLAPLRSVTQILTSSALPALKVGVSPTLSYLGEGTGIAMDGTAQYDRFLFGETRDGRLVRAVIIHFEQILPGKPGAFNYPRTNMIKLAGQEYLHQTFPVTKQEFWEAPDMAALLKSRGLEAGDLWLAGRYVRAADPAKKHEVLIFYLESKEVLGQNFPEMVKRWRPDWMPGSVAEPEWAQLEQQ